MKKIKLQFRFHDPNAAGETAEYILKLFIEADRLKLDQILEEAAKSSEAG